MPSQWIRLTGKRGDEVFINMESVTMMRPRKRFTRIWFVGSCDDHVDVFESAADIVTRLDEMLVSSIEEAPPAPVARADAVAPRYEAPRPAPQRPSLPNVRTILPASPLPVAAPVAPRQRPVSQAVARPEANGAPRSTMNGVAAKLSKLSAIKVSAKTVVPAREERVERAQMSETVAEQRDQRARRRASAIMDERRQQLARKLEQMRREKGLE